MELISEAQSRGFPLPSPRVARAASWLGWPGRRVGGAKGKDLRKLIQPLTRSIFEDDDYCLRRYIYIYMYIIVYILYIYQVSVDDG